MSEQEMTIDPELAEGFQRELTKEFIFWAAVLACFIPMLFVHFRTLWGYTHYQYFPLLLLAIPFLIQSVRDPELVPLRRRWKPAFVVAGLGWIVLLVAVLAWSPNLAAFAFAVTSGAALLYFYQSGRIERLIPVWIPMLFLVKLPVNLDVDLVFYLQGFTSRLASRLIDIAGVNHIRAGHTIVVPDQRFMVEDACSGIQSLFALLAATAIMLVLVRRGIIHSVLLFVGAIFWACMANVLRVTIVVLASEKFEIDLANGWPHDVLGLVLFAFAIVMLLSTDSFLQFLLASDRLVDFGAAPRRISFAEGTMRGEVETEAFEFRRGHYLLGGMFGLLVLGQIGAYFLTSSANGGVNVDDPRLVDAFSEETMPAEFGGWQRARYEKQSRSMTNYLGRHSAVWDYKAPFGKVTVACDYPFNGWHELTGCYTAQGCQVENREVLESMQISAGSQTFEIRPVSSRVVTAEGRGGLLVFSEFLGDGTPLSPTELKAGSFAYWRSRLESSFLRQTSGLRQNAGNYQTQILVYPERELTPEEVGQLIDLHKQTTGVAIDVVSRALAQ